MAGLRKRVRQRHKDRVAKREHGHENRMKRKEARQESRQQKHMGNIANRSARKQGRVNKRAQKIKDRYDGVTDSDIDTVKDLAPYQDAMVKDLQDRGVQVDDADDTVEVATKYAQQNPDLENPLEDEDYNDAFINDEEDFESNFEYLDRKANARKLALGVLPIVAGGLESYVNTLREKKSEGLPLTDAEKEMIVASKQTKKQVVGSDLFNGSNSILIIAFIIIIVIAVKR